MVLGLGVCQQLGRELGSGGGRLWELGDQGTGSCAGARVRGGGTHECIILEGLPNFALGCGRHY